MAEVLTFLMVLSVFVTSKVQNFQHLFDFYWYYPLYLIVIVYGVMKLGFVRLLKQKWLLFVGVIATLSLISLWINPYSYFQWAKQVAGWLLFGYAWIVIYLLQEEKNNILNIYFSIAIIAAFLTIPEQILHVLDIHITPKKGGGLGLYRCFSIVNEPFPLAMLLIPVIIYYLEQGRVLLANEKLYLLILFIGLFFTFSGGGWLVLVLYFIFSIIKRSSAKGIIMKVVMLLLLVISFTFYKGTQLRITETVSIFKHFPELPDVQTLNSTNTSSRAIYLNTIVAWKQFVQNPISGGGLGSHGEAYNEFITKPLHDKQIVIAHFNQFDGASGLIRWFSEMGLCGMLFLFMFFRQIIRQSDKKWVASELGFWIAFLIHAGNYFHNGSMMWMQKNRTYKLLEKDKFNS